MKSTIFIRLLLSVIIISGCSSEKEINLYNGKNPDNWVVKGKPEDLDKEFWTFTNEFIEANSLGIPDHDYVWLLSRKEYNDFDLRFEFQVFHESSGNSGLQVRSRYDEKNFWLNGPQIDIHPPGYWRTGMMWDETRGNQRWIFPDIPEGSWVDSTMVLGQHPMYFSDDEPAWNCMKVKVKDNHIQAWLNDVLITDFQGDGILDDPLHRNLRVGKTGHIAFQIHSGDELKIRFREIYLREL
jgi:hypothetical protein